MVEYNDRRFMKKSKKAKGIVIEIVPKSFAEENIMGTVEYISDKGRIFQITDDLTHIAFVRVGSKVDVYFDSKRPNYDVKIRSTIMISNLVYGLVALIPSLYFLYKYLESGR
jgi:hypothetical protein